MYALFQNSLDLSFRPLSACRYFHQHFIPRQRHNAGCAPSARHVNVLSAASVCGPHKEKRAPQHLDIPHCFSELPWSSIHRPFPNPSLCQKPLFAERFQHMLQIFLHFSVKQRETGVGRLVCILRFAAVRGERRFFLQGRQNCA